MMDAFMREVVGPHIAAIDWHDPVVLSILVVVVFVAFNIYDYILIPLTAVFFPKKIPVLAPELKQFNAKDYIFQYINKLCSSVFVLACIHYIMWPKGKVSVDFSNEALWRALVAFTWQGPLLFIIYDFFYTLFHWGLHLKWVYPLIHKHHHRQASPFRGFADAINVHPFEFATGDFNHLFAIFILTRIPTVGDNFHVASFVGWILFGGLLASLNHTRVNCTFGFGIYDVKYHDMHHRMPECNYGQYIMFWDKIFGTFLDYREKIIVRGREATTTLSPSPSADKRQ